MNGLRCLVGRRGRGGESAGLHGQDGTAEIVEALLVEIDVHGDPDLAAAGLMALGPRAVPALLISLSSADGRRAAGLERALMAMLGRGDAPFAELEREWPKLSPELRVAAMRALGARARTTAAEAGRAVRLRPRR